MLSHLHIENIAVIEEMEIVFDRGLNLLTGETGAGKSIIIDALGAVLGARTTRELVRTGASSAHAGAVFRELSSAVTTWLAEVIGVEAVDGELAVSRDILPDGRTVCRIAGKTATVSQLRELGALLVQIHGQHDSHALLDEDSHMGFIDMYGQCGELLESYQTRYNEWRSLCSERDALLRDDADKARRADTLNYQLDEINAAELSPGEDKILEERRSFLKNANKVSEAVETAYACLYGDEDSVHDMLSMASKSLLAVANINEELAAIANKVEELLYAADDAAEDVRGIGDGLESDPDELDTIEHRLDLIYRLKRKYGKTVENILEFAANAQRELELIESSDERLAELSAQCEAKLTDVKKAAKLLSSKRKGAVDGMCAALKSELRDLDMPNAEFDISLTPVELYPKGAETVRFLISTNVGEPPKPLSKIASGGELARIMLGLMNILHGGVATMVFDEVDTGISGRAAQKVAVKLKSVSRDKQALCVTHLPQIAAMADKHFHIEKHVEGSRTVTRLTELSRAQRAEEIARIIGGANVTAVTRETAEEMIKMGENYENL